MKAFLAITFADPGKDATYLKEVLNAIRQVAGDDWKRGNNSLTFTIIAFFSTWEDKEIHRVFRDLWRPEKQRTWILEVENPLLIDASIMDWLRTRHLALTNTPLPRKSP